MLWNETFIRLHETGARLWRRNLRRLRDAARSVRQEDGDLREIIIIAVSVILIVALFFIARANLCFIEDKLKSIGIGNGCSQGTGPVTPG